MHSSWLKDNAPRSVVLFQPRWITPVAFCSLRRSVPLTPWAYSRRNTIRISSEPSFDSKAVGRFPVSGLKQSLSVSPLSS